MPRFDAPEWLLLLPVIVFVAWYWRSPRLERPLRASILVLLVLALSGLHLSGQSDALDVWVLVDRSASVRETLEPRREEIERLLESERSTDDRLFFVDFAEEARIRGLSSEGGEVSALGLGEETRLASAIELALSGMSSERARLLLLSDGYGTEPLEAVGERLRRQGVALDLRLVPREAGRDWAVEAVEAPMRVQPREPFLLEARIRGPDGKVPVTVSRNGRSRASGTATVRNGSAFLSFSDRLSLTGAARYEVEIAAGDAVPGNDRASVWIEVDGGPRILLVTAYREDPLASVLRQQGFTVDVVTEPRTLGHERLAGARAVFLNNVPATHLSSSVTRVLEGFVRIQGGGLLMAGGKYSFGAGGYFDSPLDPLLPVSMELREDHRMLDVAMAIVMDRSGSMAMGVAGGRTKMELANEGAARSIELLGVRDAVAVFAVDSSAHRVVPLTPLREGVAAIVEPVRRVTSAGGGIYVYEGLDAAWKELRLAPQGQRHVILFADAADAENPGRYRELLEEMVAEGASVSVIGLGSPTDADAGFLEDIARRGNGRIFFNADPATLPALFAQETVAVARSAFIEEPVGVEPSAGWLEVSQAPLADLEAVDGYNLSYLREGATAAAFTTDEYRAPLVAFWSRGAGRVAAISFPLAGEHSERQRRWPGYGDFVQTLARWLMGEDAPPGAGLETRIDGTGLEVDLWYDESWHPRLSRDPAEVFLTKEGKVEELVWERIAPGHFGARAPLEPGAVYRGAVRIGGIRLPFGPIQASLGTEWNFDPRRLEELRALSKASGGVERVELSSIWDERQQGADLALRRSLVWTALALFLIEAFRSRLGWRLPAFPLADWMEQVRSLRPAASEPTAAAPAPPPESTSTPVSEPEKAGSAGERRRRRFERAKQGR